MSDIGHNSSGADFSAPSDQLTAETQGRLKTFIERIERVETDQAELAASKKEIFDELGGEGFDKKIVRKIIRYRKMDPDQRAEEDALTELYMAGIGML